ncbi:hypothetical protein [Staphylococcus aureus]|uniref:hypothetical protein n=1 Tax=Staphylococcus aureus TaxID=1280 RepID=UPI000851F4F8|nr:hypothetical protein [Staphylococcus aureus]
MYKRLFISHVIFIFVLILVITTPNFLAESQPDPKPHELHKSRKFTVLKENKKVLYDDKHVTA